jgi:D-alanyl-lipoteichoic acid acyltransferase DltB (MBOAT superfamily)
VVALYFFVVPLKWRWLLLLTASCYFYMAFIPEYILILALTIVVDYYAGIKIEESRGRAKKIYLWSSIVVTCLILFFFKYLEFVWQTGNDIREFFGVAVTADERAKFGFFLPIGLSFHTFQSLSYVIEVYWGKQKAERHFGIYSLYVLFFPQLVAGPIERPQNLLGQFRVKQNFVVSRVSSGLRLMLWGMFQKTVVADRLAMPVDFVYDSIHRAPPDAIFLASVFFAFQIYADFQGYTNIARGAARVLGFELMKNFNRPYASASVTEFWRRWHISLSTWFRDYVYVPLGGSQSGGPRNFFNLMLTFTISGLWHGANWTYVIWGAINGLFVALERLVPIRVPGLKPVKILYAFSAVLLGWVFFRAKSVGDAVFAVKNLPLGVAQFGERLVTGEIFHSQFLESCGIEAVELILAVAAVVAMEVIQLAETKKDMGEATGGIRTYFRWAAYASVLLIVIYSWMYFPASKKPFIYFQF